MKKDYCSKTGVTPGPVTLKLWKVLTIGGTSKEQLIAEVKEKANINDWVLDVINQKFFICQPIKEHVYSILVTPRQLRFTEEPLVSEMYARALSLDLKLCPIQTGLDLRRDYLDQGVDEKIHIGMELVEDSDGAEHQFYVENTTTNGLSLGSHWITATNRCGLDNIYLFRSPVLFHLRNLQLDK